MKRDFLKSLGIEDKDIIDKILDENSSDIGRAKGELETYKTKVTDLENDIKEKDGKIKDLEESNKEVTTLRDQVTQLKADKTKLEGDLSTQVTELQKSHAIENGIRDAKGKNVKAIKALLDMGKITYKDGATEGLTEQLEALAKAEDSSMLFGEAQPGNPSGTNLGNPPGGNGGNPPTAKSFADAIANALNSK